MPKKIVTKNAHTSSKWKKVDTSIELKKIKRERKKKDDSKNLTSIVKSKEAKMVRAKPKFKFSSVILKTLHTQKINFNTKDSITLLYERDLKPYTEASIHKIGDDNAPGWNCSMLHTNGTWAADQVVETNNAISKIFLGGVYNMKELAAGNAVTLPHPRKPLKIEVDSHHFKNATQKVENPTSDQIREAVNKIIRSKDMPDVAITSGSIRAFDSYSSLLTSFSGSGHFLGFGGSHKIEFNSRKKTHKFYLEAMQLYYTIKVSNTVNEPEDFFHIKEEDPTVENAVAKNSINSNWVFVDSIGYGRMLYFIFESDESYDSMDLDLQQYADYWLAAVELNESVRERIEEKNVTLQVFAMGGSPLIASTLTKQKPSDIKKAISNYFKGKNDEVPIYYSLSTLDMHQVGTKMYVDYESRKCHPKPTKYKVIWKDITCLVNDDGGDEEQVKALVRIRAFDKHNKDIMDEDELNKALIEVAKTSKNSSKMFWTFSKGNSDNPLYLKEKKFISMNKSVRFPTNDNKEIVRISIQADIIEYDNWPNPNDNFDDDDVSIKVNEIDPDIEYKLICRHEASEILFIFRIVPMYD